MEKVPSSRLRKLRTWMPGPGPTELRELKDETSCSLLDLSSNDYLGLSRHPFLIASAQASMHAEGVGAGGSRLVTGSRPIHRELEKSLGDWLGRKSVLVFPSGFQANLAAVIALANRNTPVFIDRLAHHSLIIGIKASGAKVQRFAHNDLSDLERLLTVDQKTSTTEKPLVITESLFSMEGTTPPLLQLAELCRSYDARLLVDEAHALGVMGSKGRGLCHEINGAITMISGTFGKAFGSGGAFLACNQEIGHKLLQTSGAFRYTTALAPPLAAATYAALQLIKKNPQWSTQLKRQAADWRLELEQAGWQRPLGEGPILSLIIGDDQKTLNIQSELETNGLLCVAIRPPTVPEGTSRLRIVLRRGLPDETLAKLIEVLGSK